MNKLAGQLWQYKASPSASLLACISDEEKLSWEVRQFGEGMHNSPPIWTSISAIRCKHSSAQERGYSGYRPQSTLWFYLCDHGEDMRNCDGKSTSILGAQVCELQGKTITKGVSSRKNVTPGPSRQLPRWSRRADLLSGPMERTFDLYIQEITNTMIKPRGALPPAMWKRGITGFIGLCGFGSLAHQTPRSLRL